MVDEDLIQGIVEELKRDDLAQVLFASIDKGGHARSYIGRRTSIDNTVVLAEMIKIIAKDLVPSKESSDRHKVLGENLVTGTIVLADLLISFIKGEPLEIAQNMEDFNKVVDVCLTLSN